MYRICLAIELNYSHFEQINASVVKLWKTKISPANIRSAAQTTDPSRQLSPTTSPQKSPTKPNSITYSQLQKLSQDASAPCNVTKEMTNASVQPSPITSPQQSPTTET